MLVSVLDPPYTIYMGKDKYESMSRKFSTFVKLLKHFWFQLGIDLIK